MKDITQSFATTTIRSCCLVVVFEAVQRESLIKDFEGKFKVASVGCKPF